MLSKEGGLGERTRTVSWVIGVYDEREGADQRNYSRDYGKFSGVGVKIEILHLVPDKRNFAGGKHVGEHDKTREEK